MRMEFVTWQEPEQLASRKASMREFLEGIALEKAPRRSFTRF